MRVVSLVPSSTETLRALGVDPVACSRFCEQPDLPHVGGTKNPDIDAIRELKPDVVVLDRQENRREDAEALDAAGLRVWASDVDDVAAALDVVDDLAELVGVDTPERPAVGPTVPDPLPVLVPIWRRPWMAIGGATYGASLLRRLGFAVVTGADDPRYPEVDFEAVRGEAPVAVLVPSEPYEFRDEHLGELRSAVPGARVLRVDGRDLFWWGARTHGAMTRLDEQLDELRS